jgi:competence protein ComEC
MKLPAVWLAAAFGAGIGLASRWPAGPGRLALVACALLCLAALALWRHFEFTAWIAVLVAWAALGGFASSVERAIVPPDHVTRLIADGAIDLSEPLRWRGRLRETPMELPWGRRVEIDLDHVQVADQMLPVSGGLRANLYLNGHTEDIFDDLLAGDPVQVLLKPRQPRDFMDPGAFDVRGFLARQRIDLTGALRSGELLEYLGDAPVPWRYRPAILRGELLTRIDALFPDHPDRAAVLRAMLLGDRSFVDNGIVQAFQKTSAYHVLVIAGLHVGALIVFLLWLGRRLRIGRLATALVTLTALAAYVGIVQDRTPILRAALIAAFYLCARPLFRRIDLLNTIALAALALLIWKPSSLTDSSFQLSFLAAAVIAGLAIPWIDRTSASYRIGLDHLGDVTRDTAHSPRVAQFRIELRAAAALISTRVPAWLGARVEPLLAAPVRVGLRLWEIVLLSVVIQLGMLPLMTMDFHRISLSGPISNVPAVLLTAVIVPLGFLTLLATYLWGKLAMALAKALSVFVGWLLALVTWFAKFPRLTYRAPDPPAWLVVTFFAAIVALAICARAVVALRRGAIARRQPSAPIRVAEWAAIVAVASLAALIATHPFRPNLPRGQFQVTVLDVGQGDSLFLSFPTGHTMLIDGGGLAGSEYVHGTRSGADVGEEVVSPFLWSLGLKRIDVVALSHAHHDHLDGLHAILQNFRVGELWVGRDEATPAFESLLDEAKARGVRIVTETQGTQFDFDGVDGSVLWPVDVSTVTKAANDNSLVLKVQDGAEKFLLPGDIERRVENDLVDDGAPLAADFLKVPHHGSRTSSTDSFVAAVAPKFAVVSVGEDNPFGHPVEAVVERYQAAGTRFLRTDRDGAVTATTDGKTLTVTTYAEQHPSPQQPR